MINSIEPNDTIREAITIEDVDDEVILIFGEIGDNPNLAPENDVDLFEVELDEGELLTVDINADEIGSELDPILSVFNSKGELVVQNDDFSNLDSLITFAAKVEGTYYVGVSSFDNFNFDPFIEGSGTGDSSGFYELSFSVDEFEKLENIIEPNDTIREAITIEDVDDEVILISSEIGDNPNLAPENDVDLFGVELDEGELLTADINANEIGSELDPILSVFNSEGELVAQNDDFGNLDSLITFTAEVEDTYYVGVSSFNNFNFDPFIEGSGTGDSSGFYDLFLSVDEFESD